MNVDHLRENNNAAAGGTRVTVRHTLRKEEVMWREVNKQVTVRHTERKEEVIGGR